MFAATMRKWFGVQSNYKDDDYQNRTIRGNWLGRRYELTVGGKRNDWCAYYRADAHGVLMIRFAKIALWIATRKKKKQLGFFEEEGAAQWGWNIMDDQFVVYLGNKPQKGNDCITMRSRSHYIPFPWAWRRHRDYTFMRNAEWMDTAVNKPDVESIQQWVIPFTYVTKYDETQESVATIKITKLTYRWAWFKWLPWPSKTIRYAEFKYTNAVGHDRSGWKGGVLGGSITMLTDEEASDTLKRVVGEQRYG